MSIIPNITDAICNFLERQMLEGKELDEAIANHPFAKVTAAYMESRIKKIEYTTALPLTLCIIWLDNGYASTGISSCVDPRNYDKEIGESIAYKRAFDGLWPLFGFLLAEKLFLIAESAKTLKED